MFCRFLVISGHRIYVYFVPIVDSDILLRVLVSFRNVNAHKGLKALAHDPSRKIGYKIGINDYRLKNKMHIKSV